MVKKTVTYDRFYRIELTPEKEGWQVTIILEVSRGGKSEEATIAEEAVRSARIDGCTVDISPGKIVVTPTREVTLKIFHDIESNTRTMEIS
ncbi:MAG: hypothetical protein QXW47_11525 [Candidatus Jordarchaeales archaeon]|nr:hypothetical protein [Candidatus Jordarchaeia archaeon]